MIDMAQAVTCERSPGSTKSRLLANPATLHKSTGSTIRQRGEAERTRSVTVEINEGANHQDAYFMAR